MNRDRRLGRGLAALLGDPGENGLDMAHARIHEPFASTDETEATDPVAGTDSLPHAEPSSREILVRVEDIEVNPFQPRREFGKAEISSLAESLKEHDLLSPVLVRRNGERWQLISGERRLRAAIEAGWTKIPARVKEADDRLVAELAIVENLQRKDLNPIEKALSFQRYLREHGSTQEELGKRLKIDRSTIANLMRLLELPPLVQAALRDSKISAGHARALLPLGDAPRQEELCDRICREGWSVRETERTVQEVAQQIDAGAFAQVTAGSADSTSKPRTGSGQLSSLELELRRALGTKVAIKQRSNGIGKIEIQFKGEEEFERLRRYLLDGSVSDRVTDAG